MKTFLFIILAVGFSYPAQRTVVEKILKPDTSLTIKTDTLKSVCVDTLKITKVFLDTSYVIKEDTATVSGKATPIKSAKK